MIENNIIQSTNKDTTQDNKSNWIKFIKFHQGWIYISVLFSMIIISFFKYKIWKYISYEMLGFVLIGAAFILLVSWLPEKIKIIVVGTVIIYLVGGWVVMNAFLFFKEHLNNVTSVNQLVSWRPSFDLGLYFSSSTLQPVRDSVFLLLSLAVAYLWIQIFSEMWGSKEGVSARYGNKNYSKLMSRIGRMRGTQRLKFGYQNNVSNKNIESLLSWLKTPFVYVQNRYCEWRLLPKTKYWNTSVKKIEGGFPVIATRKYYLFGKWNQVWYITGDVHNLFVGSTGRGKTFTFVLAMIYSYIYADESLVIHDPKSELYAMSKSKLREAGYQVIVLNFIEPARSEGWNPLRLPYEKWKEACGAAREELKKQGYVISPREYKKKIQQCYVLSKEDGTEDILPVKQVYRRANTSEAVELTLDIARTLSFQEDAKDPFWHEGAGDMIAGAALLLFEEGVEEYINFKSVNFIIDQGDELLSNFIKNHREIDDASVMKLNTYLNAEGLTKSSLKSVFKNKISLVNATIDMQRMLGQSSFEMQHIYDDKTAVFLCTHDEKSTYYPLVTMFFKQLYEVGIKDSRDQEDRRLQRPMNWVIDEFAQLPELKDIEQIYGAARSRGVRINAFIQSFSQLINKYGRDVAAIIEDNSTNVLYLGSQTQETREKFSQLAGKELVYSKSEKRYKERPVISEDQLKRFERGRSLLSSIEWDPYVIKLPPFNKYTFAQKPDWSKDPVVEREVVFFDIRNYDKDERIHQTVKTDKS